MFSGNDQMLLQDKSNRSSWRTGLKLSLAKSKFMAGQSVLCVLTVRFLKSLRPRRVPAGHRANLQCSNSRALSLVRWTKLLSSKLDLDMMSELHSTRSEVVCSEGITLKFVVSNSLLMVRRLQVRATSSWPPETDGSLTHH